MICIGERKLIEEVKRGRHFQRRNTRETEKKNDLTEKGWKLIRSVVHYERDVMAKDCKDTHSETGDPARLPAQLAGR